MIGAGGFALLRACSARVSLKEKRRRRQTAEPGRSLPLPASLVPGPSHQESCFLVVLGFANEYCVCDGRVKSTCVIYFNIYTDDRRSN